MVRIPIATSIKKVENPVIKMRPSFEKSFFGRTNLSEFFFVKKCEIITTNEIAEPIAVASPAPNIPKFSGKTKT